VPVTTTVPINNQISVNIVAMVNGNQSNITTSVPLTVKNYTSFSGFTLFVSLFFFILNSIIFNKIF
jgi:hypothetical protein